MKTSEDLNKHIPAIVELFGKNNHEIGETFWDEEVGSDAEDYETNYFTYDEDGIFIEVTYECCGEYYDDPGDYWTPPCHALRRAWGRVTDIKAVSYGFATGEEKDVTGDQLKELRDALNQELKNIA